MATIGDRIAELALRYEGYPYVAATQGPNSFDCSGFTKYVITQITGDWTPASARDYPTHVGEIGQTIPLSQARPGDVLCYERDDLPAGVCGHVGIWYAPNMMINALNEDRGVVRTDISTSWWTSRFICVRRFYPYVDEPVGLPTGTRGPSFSGKDLPLVASQVGGTASSGVGRSIDDNVDTSWYSTGAITTSTLLWVIYDLGQVKKLSGITWDCKIPEGMHEFEVKVGNNPAGPWTVIGNYQAGQAYTRYGVELNHQARYVGLTIKNPKNVPAIGYLREFGVWGNEVSAYSMGTLNPTFVGQKVTLTNSGGSSNGNSASRVRDGNTGTPWLTVDTSPTSGSFWVDLGSSKPMTGIKWFIATPDAAEQFTVEAADSISGPWTSLGTFTEGSVGEWRGVTTNLTRRFVRFTFANPNSREVLGGIGEVHVWVQSPTGTWTHKATTSLNLRTGPSTSNPVIGVLPTGTRLKLVSTTPTSAGGYTWYNVNAEGFGTGWCVNGFDPI